MKQSTILILFLKFYRLLWTVALPFLRRNHRLRQGLAQRLSCSHLHQSDIWIQGASAGESYLSAALLKHFSETSVNGPKHQPNSLKDTRIYTKPRKPRIVLLTTTTSQGMGILKKVIDQTHGICKTETGTSDQSGKITVQASWFPFDIPELMDEALSRVNPKCIVLLETELWPGLLAAARKKTIPVILINGRLSEKSFRNYMLTKKLWRSIAPETVMSTSTRDAERFRKLFPRSAVEKMSNIKFDLLTELHSISDSDSKSKLNVPSQNDTHLQTRALQDSRFFWKSETDAPPPCPISIFASIRKEEERDILHILPQLLKKYPKQVILIFPRHMHRIDAWKKNLSALTEKQHHGKAPSSSNTYQRATPSGSTFSTYPTTTTSLPTQWQLRSQLSPPLCPSPGTIILWDTFGELKRAYEAANVAFVGGSLKPLGGHNYIEPLIAGTPTVTGPFLNDFNWVGDELFNRGVVKKATDKNDAMYQIIHYLTHPVDRRIVINRTSTTLNAKQGGAETACRMIQSYLN